MLYRTLTTIHISISYSQLDTINHLLRKVGHFAGYGLLTLLFFRAWFYTLRQESSNARFRLRCAALALLVTLLTAMADEWHQSFDLSRTGTSKDVVLDMTGGITGQILAFGIYTSWRKERGAQRSAISTSG